LHLDRLFAGSRFWSRNPLLRGRELQQARVLILNTLANRYLPQVPERDQRRRQRP
jgi:hypothetical protein